MLWRLLLLEDAPRQLGSPERGRGYTSTVERAIELKGNRLSLAEPRTKVHRGMVPPKQVRFPDGMIREVSSWEGLLVQVADWLFGKIYLEVTDLPIRVGERGRRSIVHRESKHSDGGSMRAPYEVRPGVWLETNVSVLGAVRYVSVLLHHAKIGAEEVLVLFESHTTADQVSSYSS